MVKRRANTDKKSQKLSEEKLEAFAAGAEGEVPNSPKKAAISLNKNATRDYKQIRVTFNEYEYNQLEKGSALTGTSKLSFIRRAILELTEKVEHK